MRKTLTSATLVLVLLLASTLTCYASQKVKFCVPPWPGVKVKTEVAMQVLDAMGYETLQRELSPSISLTSMQNGDMDVYLAGWVPLQSPMIDPVLAKGRVELVTTNLDDAEIGLCVPSYVYDQGVHSVLDLDGKAGEFKSTVYNIEMGSGMYRAMEEVIEKDGAGLGDWKHVGSVAPIMISNVKGMEDDREWVVFGCWKPHWMTLKLDLKFLEGAPETEVMTNGSEVVTLARTDFKDDNPNVYRFFQQFKVNSKIQSRWIYEYSYNKRRPHKVAKQWIQENLDKIDPWLAGVTTIDGKPALDAVRAKFAKS